MYNTEKRILHFAVSIFTMQVSDKRHVLYLKLFILEACDICTESWIISQPGNVNNLKLSLDDIVTIVEFDGNVNYNIIA